MKLQSLQSIVNSMLRQYKEYGIADASLGTYKNGFCSPVIRFFDEKNGGTYSSDMLDLYAKIYREKFLNHEISWGYYSMIARIVRILKSVAETGTADFSSAKPEKKYITSSEHLDMTNHIIELNHIPPGSIKNFHTRIRHIFCYIESRGIADKDLTDMVFFDYLAEVSNSHAGCRGETMKAVRLTTQYLKTNGSDKLRTDFSLLPYKRPVKRMVPPYSYEEIKAIVDAIDITQPIGKRDYAIMLLAFDTGLRASDIITLKMEDVNWNKGTLSIKQSKTKYPITQPLKGVVLNALADYILDVRPSNGEKEIFLSQRPPFKAFRTHGALDSILEKYCKLASIEKKPRRAFHSIRRAFATELSLKGIPICEISELLGHRSLNSDKPYLSYSKENIAFVAGDFSEIPLTGGIYAEVLNAKGGVCNGIL